MNEIDYQYDEEWPINDDDDDDQYSDGSMVYGTMIMADDNNDNDDDDYNNDYGTMIMTDNNKENNDDYGGVGYGTMIMQYQDKDDVDPYCNNLKKKPKAKKEYIYDDKPKYYTTMFVADDFNTLMKKYQQQQNDMEDVDKKQQYKPMRVLHRFSKINICKKIESWIYNDIKYIIYSKKAQEIFKQHKLCGKLISMLLPEDAKLIVKDEMLQFMTMDTLNIIFEGFDKWKDKDPNGVKKKSPNKIASILYKFPLKKLIKRIKDENINGAEFIKKQYIIQEETGWSEQEAYQISSMLLKYHAFTVFSFEKNMNNVLKSLPNNVVNKIKEIILKFDVDTLHYKIKNAENIDEFSDAIINMVGELIENKIQNNSGDVIIKTIYEAIAECFIFNEDTKGLEQQKNWICGNCSNNNVINVIANKMNTNISICVLC
eukprot:392850_1